MVSRKTTTNSKGRKAANEGNKTVKEKAKSTGPQMQRQKAAPKVQADDDVFLEEAILIAATEKRALEAAAAASEEERRQDDVSGNDIRREVRDDEAIGRCWHGYERVSSRQNILCRAFVTTFGTVHDSAVARNEDGFAMGIRATEEKHPEVWRDQRCIESTIRLCLFLGTLQLQVKEQNYKGARLFASLARYLEEVIAVNNNAQNDIYWTKVFELYGAEEHTLVKYFRRRIPCACLDSKYNEVKHMTKLGICYNPSCPLPDRKVERCKLMHCTRCRQANYCSEECQLAAWTTHKKSCVDWRSKKKTEAELLDSKHEICREGSLTGISKAVAQEWSEVGESNHTHGW